MILKTPSEGPVRQEVKECKIIFQPPSYTKSKDYPHKDNKCKNSKALIERLDTPKEATTA